MELKNRICMPAIHHCYTPDGFVNERLIRYYETRASGGAALITVGGCTIDMIGPGPMMIGAHDDQFIPGLAKLAEAINSKGAKSAAQLYQAGRYTHSIMTGQQALAPSPIASRLTRETPKEMSAEEIETVIDSFIAAAIRIKEAGFDAVEIIASAGYLICQFLSPITNQRNDQYGGSWENRARFGREVIRRTRQALGPDYTLIVRLSGHDFMPGSNGNLEAARFAAELESDGVNLFNITGGWHESRVPQITGELPRGGFAYLARGIKEAVHVPVIASNRINDPHTAEQIIAEGFADLVNMGRPLIADPDLPAKAEAGKPGSIRRCIACNQGCLDMVFTLQDVHCTVNPMAGREDKITVKPADKSKKILIVGGGPAGMETALTAAKRGHQVTLWEKGPRLGGHLTYAAMPPGKEDFLTLLHYYEHELPLYGVDIFLNRDAKPGEIIDFGADTTIIATGAGPADPPFKISEPAKVISALKVLDGSIVPGPKAVVIGGGSVGCETAAFLAERGTLSAGMLKFLFENNAEEPDALRELLLKGTHEVTLVEMEKGIGRDIGISTRWVVLQCLHRRRVKVLDQCQVMDVTAEGVLVEKDGSASLIPADNVVLAIGARADKSLIEELEGKTGELHVIGDALKPRKLTEAIREGFDLGRSV